jgi:hypothetical protein
MTENNRVMFLVVADSDNEMYLRRWLREFGWKHASFMSRSQVKRIMHTFLEKEFNDAADTALREGPEGRSDARSTSHPDRRGHEAYTGDAEGW